MAAVKKNVALSFGLLTATVNILSALEAKERNVTVCTGAGGHPAHDPVRIKQENVCSQCGPIHFHEIQKAREVGDGLVLLTAEDIMGAAIDASEHRVHMKLTPHPVGPVEADTAPGGKAYFLEPVAGHEQTYKVLMHLIEAHPELAFVTRYTPRTSMGVFRVSLRDGALLMQERVAGDRIKAAPTFNAVEVPEPMLGLAEQVLALDGVIADFDLASYRDQTEDRIAAIVASRTPQAEIARDSSAAPAPVKDAMAALQEMLGAKLKVVPDAKAKPPRKRASKKAAAPARKAG